MKRVRLMPAPSSAWSLPNSSEGSKIPLKQENSDGAASDRKQTDRRECWDGIIDNALAAFQCGGNTIGTRDSQPAPGFPSRYATKDFQKSPLPNNFSARSNGACPAPFLETSCTTFEPLPATNVLQQSATLALERDPFLRVGAEIDEILSPVSDCPIRPLSFVQSLPCPPSPSDVTSSGVEVARIRDDIQTTAETSSKGASVHEFLTAMESPHDAATSRRRGLSPSTRCHLCGKTYTESSNLSKHIRTVHLKLRPFQCSRCPSSFAEKNKLGKHIQSVHEHARPYKCELCAATFSQASDRKRHRLVLHEGCRPFACGDCGKAFGRRSSLTQHSHRVHKRSKPNIVGQLACSKQK